MKTPSAKKGSAWSVFLGVLAALVFFFVILPAGCSLGMAGCAAKVIKDEHDRQQRADTPAPQHTPKKRH